MKKPKLHLCLAHMGGHEREYVQEAFDSGWVAPLGPNVDIFESQLERFLGGGKPVTAVSSGTAALHLALVLLGVGKGDEVICSDWTFIASANPIVYQGAVPVFVDSEPASWNMSPELLEQAIEHRKQATGRLPKAIIVVHLYGMPAEMDKIMDVANRYGIPVVEDSAEAMGSEFDGKPCGTFGDYGILSFNGNKMITTSGGGALICPTEEESRRALFYATQAKEPVPYYQHEHTGYNYRMSNICAGIGRGQMEVVDEHIAHHRRLARLYGQLLSEVDGITLHKNPTSKHNSNYWLNAVLVDPEKTGITHMDLYRHLAEEGIESRPLWKPMHMQPVFKDAPCYLTGVGEKMFSMGLCIPSGPCVGEDDVVRIVDEIKRCIRS